MQTTELIAQIQAIAADYESALADANKWRTLLNHLGKKDYGPRITAEQIVSLIPAASDVAAVAEASREPKRDGRKVAKRKPPSRPGAGPAEPSAQPAGQVTG